MSMEQIQGLREQTGAGVLDVKKALDEASGDTEKALELLRKRGSAIAEKKAGRDAGEGVIMSYIHMDKIGVLVEINCETDFVARNEDFKAFAKDIAMQIASMKPKYLVAEDIPQEVLDKEKEIYLEQIEGDKPDDVKEKIVEGKVKKYADEVCLMNQKFFKNEDQTIAEVVTEAVAKMGENIQIRRFVRYSLDDHEKTQNS